MKNAIKMLAGANAISVFEGLRRGVNAFGSACIGGFEGARRRSRLQVGGVPEMPLFDLLRGIKPTISLAADKYEDGTLPLDQLIALLSILVVEKPEVVLEIGTFMGHTTRAMALNVPTATIHTVDLPENFVAGGAVSTQLKSDDFHLINRRKVGREFLDNPCNGRIVQHFADTAQWDFTEAADASFFFIDGSHTYEYCRNDSEKCLALCGGRGVFLWHDCDLAHPGVVKLIQEWRRAGRSIVRITDTPIAYWKAP